MEQSKKDVIENVLRKLSFVNWDKYFEYEGGLSFFGWIDREDDNYKDFVLIDFVGNNISYGTSSKEYSKKIADILNQDHSNCKRVEHFWDIPNVIKFKGGRNSSQA